jgi:hypothetical protein
VQLADAVKQRSSSTRRGSLRSVWVELAGGNSDTDVRSSLARRNS